MSPKILFENKDHAVLDKPSGLQVHPDGRSKGPFLTDWLLENVPEVKGVGEPLKFPDGSHIEKPGIVHRLDTETSGVIAVCKNQKAFLHLKGLFKERKVWKIYNAFTYGHFSEKTGIIDRPIGKSRKDFRMWSAQRGAKGKLRAALTEYEVLEEGQINGEKASFVEVRPKTGRTHQIRVHMKAIHHPVVCDRLYAPKQDCLGFSRLALHALEISFESVSGEEIRVRSELPEEFTKKLLAF